MGLSSLLMLAVVASGNPFASAIPVTRHEDLCIRLYERSYKADERVVAQALSDAQSSNESLEFFNATLSDDAAVVYYIFSISRTDDSWKIYQVAPDTGATIDKFHYSEWTSRGYCKPRPGPNHSFKPNPLRGSA